MIFKLYNIYFLSFKKHFHSFASRIIQGFDIALQDRVRIKIFYRVVVNIVVTFRYGTSRK